MTNVAPTNLKLVGRATFLVQSHANQTLRAARGGEIPDVGYGEANAGVFDAMEWCRARAACRSGRSILSTP